MMPPLGKEAHALALNVLGRIMNLNYLFLVLQIQIGEDPKRT
jgi:hypothetical protein